MNSKGKSQRLLSNRLVGFSLLFPKTLVFCMQSKSRIAINHQSRATHQVDGERIKSIARLARKPSSEQRTIFYLRPITAPIGARAICNHGSYRFSHLSTSIDRMNINRFVSFPNDGLLRCHPLHLKLALNMDNFDCGRSHRLVSLCVSFKSNWAPLSTRFPMHC